MSKVNKQNNRLTNAEGQLREVLLKNPKQPELWYQLGVVLREQNRNQEALESFEAALRYDSKHANALCLIGQILLDGREFDKAGDALNKAMDIDPGNQQVFIQMGLLHLEKRDFKKAALTLQHAVKLNPSNTSASAYLAYTFLKSQQYHQAEKMCELILRVEPDNKLALYYLALVYRETNRMSLAIELFKRVIGKNKDFLEAYNALGGAYSVVGEFQNAIDCYKAVINRDPKRGVAAYNLTYVKGFKPEKDFLNQLEVEYRQAEEHMNKVSFGFAVARSYESQKNYDKAYEYYEQANNLHFKAYPFDSRLARAHYERITSAFNKDFLLSNSGFGSSSKKPIFILGMPRSGTTLIEQVLSSHSKVNGGGELTVLSELAQKGVQMLTQRPYPESIKLLSHTHTQQLSIHYLTYLEQAGLTADRVTDKMPGNYYHIGLIYLMFPNAKIIHCRRDPIDTCVSIYKQCFYGRHEYGSDFTALGETYKLYLQYMRHWQEVLPPAHIFDLQYEDMVTNSAKVTKQLLEFCELEWEDACLHFHENDRAVRTASISQVRSPIYSGSIGSWKAYEKHLEPLLTALG